MSCYRIAKSKGRNPQIWALFGLFSNIIALLAIFFLPSLLNPQNPQNPQNPNQALKRNWVPPTNFSSLASKIRQNLNALTKKMPPVTNIATQIRELAQLRDDGLISDSEFQDKKQKLLDII